MLVETDRLIAASKLIFITPALHWNASFVPLDVESGPTVCIVNVNIYPPSNFISVLKQVKYLPMQSHLNQTQYLTPVKNL
jgi:hypothetical protein